MKLLVTGGAGFIGSTFVRMVLGDGQVRELVVLDKLTYAGNLENLVPAPNDLRCRLVHGDICDAAAESHAATARCPISSRSPHSVPSTGACVAP